MPKAKLIFNLPEEQEEFEICNRAMLVSGGVHTFKAWLRGIVKHGGGKKTPEEAYEECYSMIFECVPDNE